MKTFTRLVTLTLIAHSLTVFAAESQRPNILWIVTDDQRSGRSKTITPSALTATPRSVGPSTPSRSLARIISKST